MTGVNRGQPEFHVGDIPVFGDLILSPMDGFSDLPFRSLAHQLGSAMSYSEFINAIDVVNRIPKIEKRLEYKESERPVVFQIFDNKPDRILQAALILQEKEPDIMDINMGCSAKTVSGRGAGAGLLRAPEKIAEIFQKLTKALDVPVTGKIRLGWDEDNLNYLEVAHIIEDNGGKLVAVHGRTRAQKYTSQANWDAIAEIKQTVSIPVIGNGDVKSVEDIKLMKKYTQCDAVMIGRAAIGNPWIFAGLNREDVSFDQVKEMMIAHLESMLSFYGQELGLLLFRKHANKYISPHKLTRCQRVALLTSETLEDFNALLIDIAATQDVEKAG